MRLNNEKAIKRSKNSIATMLTTILCCASLVRPQTGNSVRVVVDFSPSQNFTEKWIETLEGFLDMQIGLQLNATFSLAYYKRAAISLDDLLSLGRIDFYLCAPSACACAAARYNAIPILKEISTLKQSKGVGFGGVLVASANDSKIYNASSVVGARIGSVNLGDWDSAISQEYSLLKSGFSVFRDAKLIATSSMASTISAEEILAMVSGGELDIAMISSDTPALVKDASKYKILDLHPALATSRPSADSIPGWGLLAFPHVPPRLRLSVASALLRPDAPRRPAAADIGPNPGWAVAQEGYMGVVRAMEATGALSVDPATDGFQCLWDRPGFDSYQLVSCPPGHYRVPEAAARRACADAGVPCPAPACWCGACRPAAAIEVSVLLPARAAAAGAAAAAPCAKMAVCAQARQREPLAVRALDNLLRPVGALSLAFRLRDLTASGDSDMLVASGLLLPDPAETWLYLAGNVSAGRAGMYALEVSAGGVQLDSSPFLVRVLPAECAGLATPDETDGTCRCAGTSVAVGAACVNGWYLVLAVLVPFCAAGAAAWRLLQAAEEDESEKSLRHAVAGVRAALRIGRRDGYVLSTERLPPGARPRGFLRRSDVEAAARLALRREFDARRFDSLCASLQDDVGLAARSFFVRAGSEPLVQHRLLREWLLRIARDLLDPRAEPATLSDSGGGSFDRKQSAAAELPSPCCFGPGKARVASSGSAAPSSPSKQLRRGSSIGTPMGTRKRRPSLCAVGDGSLENRFRYFEERVSRCQIWRDDGGELFLQLKAVAQGFMDQLAEACDQRFAALAEEPDGQALVATRGTQCCLRDAGNEALDPQGKAVSGAELLVRYSSWR